MIGRAFALLAATGLLSACGDDLESRQAAVAQHSAEGGQITVGQRQSAATTTSPSSSTAPPAQAFDDDRAPEPADEPAPFDAGGDSLVDDAQGFSTDPLDDTSGFDPTPSVPGGFAPEPMAPESFED